jgi:hypothetical protein
MLALSLSLLVTGSAGAQIIAIDELHQGDLIYIALSRGGEIRGHAVAQVGETLRVVMEQGSTDIHVSLISEITLLERTSAGLLPQVDAPLDEESPEGRRALRRARAHANGLAVASFLLPGVGQFANGQPGLGSTYLAGILILDAAIVLSVVVNENPVVAIILGALDLAARFTSAIHARHNAPGIALLLTAPDHRWRSPSNWTVGLTIRWAIGPAP